LEVSLKKIIVREVACVTKWDLSEDVKTIVKAAENRFDIYMKEHCGINSQLMMPGNYAMCFHDERGFFENA
jgi:hypothetical protein